MIAIFSLSLILNMVSLEALGEAPKDNDITDLYYNILIGELFPSGNVYLERFSLLNARKIALFHIKNFDYDVLLSLYNTHGIEYASTVYVIDFIKNGKIIFTKEKYNTDGPYWTDILL